MIGEVSVTVSALENFHSRQESNMSPDYQGTSETSSQTRREAETRNLRDAARDYLERGKDKAIEVEEGLEQLIQDHPIRSVLIAAGVGALIGALVCRR